MKDFFLTPPYFYLNLALQFVENHLCLGRQQGVLGVLHYDDDAYPFPFAPVHLKALAI